MRPMNNVAAGEPLKRLLGIAYQANIPVLLEGRHGIGKSQILEDFAEDLELECRVFDLSLMEPTDLVGLPRCQEDKTVYAPPASLPTTGEGIIVFEELNRCYRHVRNPCLQLLTARRLNDYTLPDGWLPCAAINPLEDGYMVDELDHALTSRFVKIKVTPSVPEWLDWAAHNGVHEKVRAFVEGSPKVFDDPVANPRGWVFASQLIAAWEENHHRDQENHDDLVCLLAGCLNDTWALAFARFYSNHDVPLEPADILDHYAEAGQPQIQAWVGQGRLDQVKASLELLKRHIQAQPVYDEMMANSIRKANAQAFFADLPADLRGQFTQWLRQRGFNHLTDPHSNRKKVKR